VDDAEYEIYNAEVDTTFCLINKSNYSGNWKNHIRIAGNFTAKHLPWYKKNKIFDLYDNYLENKKTTYISTTSTVITSYFENIPKVNKILLFGSTGMLGRYIYSYFKNTTIEIVKIKYKATNTNFDLLDQLLIDNQINDTTCVINCIGLIPQRKSPESDKEYFLINSIFPQLLCNVCKKYNAKMIQPSTDFVFSGKKGNYMETDIHDEIGSYGMSKSLGEPYGCAVIRASVIGKEMCNKQSFLEWVISNQIWNGITRLEYCKIIEKMIRENIFWEGVRHIHSPTRKNKYELSSIISKTFQLDIEIIPSESIEIIDKTLSSNYHYFEIPEIDLQLNELKEFNLL
jgi:dTDP-4-dehydrorhamnose reductase